MFSLRILPCDCEVMFDRVGPGVDKKRIIGKNGGKGGGEAQGGC
jgi:hypothetical protein